MRKPYQSPGQDEKLILLYYPGRGLNSQPPAHRSFSGSIGNGSSGADHPLGAVLDPMAAPISEMHIWQGGCARTPRPLGAVLDTMAAPIVSEMHIWQGGCARTRRPLGAVLDPVAAPISGMHMDSLVVPPPPPPFQECIWATPVVGQTAPAVVSEMHMTAKNCN